jgi:tetratricopeptide (TPR) repeat protein/Mrp family chromosome partitioning ATPase
MALANVAWILAANGRRVLAADWDLESPGLHRFLYPFIEQGVRDSPGIIELIRDYERAAGRSDEKSQIEQHISEHARVQQYAFSLNWKFPEGGTLDFLSPGKQNRDYMATLSAMNWDEFYESLRGGQFLDELRADMKRHYDYVLIDSRTGLSDVADICTLHLPDILVDCFALSTQSIEGAAQVAKVIAEQYASRGIRILPVPMRVDHAEKERVEASRAFAAKLFAGLPAGLSEAERREYWLAVEVQYQPFYSYEEMLAVFGDAPGSPTSLLSSFERITAKITDGAVTRLPAMDENLRNRAKLLFVRRLLESPKVIRVNARNMRFTGREKDLRELREQLRSHGTTVVVPVTLQGLGGVGKTQVALEYVHRFKNDYDLVWWMECGQPQFIDISLADLGDRMQTPFGIGLPTAATVEEKARLVLEILSQGMIVPRWLLVYDNAEDISAVEPYLPSGGGHVLITSRNGAWAERARALPIEVFTREESVSHLCGVVPSLSPEDAAQVAEVLGDLPLAVATAAAWLSDTNYSVSAYLRQLEHEAPSVLSVGQLAAYPRSVATAWDPSLNLLQERSPAAARLLELCSVMSPVIARDLIYSRAMARALEPFDPALAEPMIMGRVVQEATKLALLKLDPDQIQIHRLVQAVVRGRMSQEKLASTRRDVQHILVAARPLGDVDDPDVSSRYRLIWPHLAPSEAVSSEEEPVRQLIVDRVRFLWLFFDLDRGSDEAIEAGKRWEAILATAPKPEMALALRRQLLQLRFNHANILRDLFRFQEAKDLDESVVAAQTELLKVDHPHTLMTAGGLAADLRALGYYREALQMDQGTYRAWTKLYGEDNRLVLKAANNLAVSFRLTGDITAASELDVDTFERSCVTLGGDNPFTLLSARNVVRDLLEAGEYTKAVIRAEDVLRSCAEALGADSVATQYARMLLGIAKRSAGRPEEAEPYFVEALAGFTRRLTDNSSDTLACRLSHAVNLGSLDRVAQAEDDIRRVLAAYHQRLGSTHPHTLVCQVNLASTLGLRSRHGQALEIISAAADGLESVLGTEHPYTLAAMMVFGSLLAERGDLNKAEEVEARTTRMLARTLGSGHPDTLGCRANLLLTRKQRGDRDAAANREQIIWQLATLIGPEHPNIETLRRERRLMRALDPQPF